MATLVSTVLPTGVIEIQSSGHTTVADAIVGISPGKDAAFAPIDLSAAVTVAERYTFRLGASNILDKDPPLNGSSTCPAGPCNGNTWPQAYDALGRQIFATLRIDF